MSPKPSGRFFTYGDDDAGVRVFEGTVADVTQAWLHIANPEGNTPHLIALTLEQARAIQAGLGLLFAELEARRAKLE